MQGTAPAGGAVGVDRAGHRTPRAPLLQPAGRERCRQECIRAYSPLAL